MPRFEKGKSGNPEGRPRRVLSEILAERGLQKRTRDVTVGALEVTDQQFLADKVWQLATQGWVDLDGTIHRVRSAREWMGVIMFLYQHIDGKPTQELGGEMIVHVVRGAVDASPNQAAGAGFAARVSSCISG